MKNLYRETFDQVHASDALRKEVANMTKREQRSARRRMPRRIAVLAAVLALALTGTVLAAVGMPETLRGWFAREWQEETGQDISQEQLALIDHLTQAVEVSDTRNGTTVTLDSVTVGNSSLWMMLTVSGVFEENEDLRYHFGGTDMILTPNPDEQTNTPGSYGFSYPYAQVLPDGRLMILIQFQVDLAGLASLADEPREAELLVSDVVCNDLTRSGDEDVVLAEGDWTLRFTLEPRPGDLVELSGPIPVQGRHTETQETKSVDIWDVRLTATDITYVQSQEDQMYDVRPFLVLDDGSLIRSGGGSARFRDEAYTEWSSVSYWPVPVDLDQVTALRIGETVLPLA